ncbi:MAG: nicotinate-nucleotide--dimethylbenzimidazole phosphoribosyltransferase [Pseudomonadota bacterium]
MNIETELQTQHAVPEIPPVDPALDEALRHKIDTKTKPIGALGLLEDVALQLGRMQQTLAPTVRRPAIVVFAADHGITAEGVSPYPQEVTAQMVANFLAGGAAINAFAEAHDIALTVVDAGVACEIPGASRPRDARIGAGTANMRIESAMTGAELREALRQGQLIADELADAGTNLAGFGEMGIGNTSAATVLTHLLTGTPVAACTGRGTGLDDTGLARKIDTLEDVARRVRGALDTEPCASPAAVLRECGGFEIAMMTGAMLGGAARGVGIVVDGFIAGAALLAAAALRPAVLDYCIFAHRSEEPGHAAQLRHLGARPLLDLNMRLGEGTGAALAIPLVRSATAFMNNMASFESAGVSDRADD